MLRLRYFWECAVAWLCYLPLYLLAVHVIPVRFHRIFCFCASWGMCWCYRPESFDDWLGIIGRKRRLAQ